MRIVVFLLLLLFPVMALAQASPEKLELTFQSEERLVEARALFIPAADLSEDPQTEIRGAKLKKAEDGKWSVEVVLPKTDLAKNSKLSVLVKTEDGRFLPGPVSLLGEGSQAELGESKQEGRKLCMGLNDPRSLQALLFRDKERLQKVIDVRQARVDVLQTKLKTILTPEVLGYLSELERSLGLTTQPALADVEEPKEYWLDLFPYSHCFRTE